MSTASYWVDPNLNAFQRFLEGERHRLDLKVSELAERCGLRYQTLRGILYVNVGPPNTEVLQALARGFGTSYEYMLESLYRYYYGVNVRIEDTDEERRLVVSSRKLEPHEFDAVMAFVDTMVRAKGD